MSKIEQGSSFKETLKNDHWVIPFFKQYRSALILAIFLGLCTFITASALMFTSGYLISRAAEMPWNILMIHMPLILVRIFGVSKPAFNYVERLTSHNWVLRMTSNLRLKLYTVLERDAIFFRSSHRTGDILGLLSEDIGHIQNLYLRTVFPTVIAWLLYTIIIIALGCFSWWFAVVMLLLLGVAVFLVPLVSVLVNRARQARKKATKNKLYSELTDNVLGVSDWVFSQRGAEYLKSYKETEHSLREADAAINKFARKRDLVVRLVFALASVLLLMWAGDYFGGMHGETSNWIAAFILGFFPLIDAFTPLSAAASDADVFKDSITRLNELPDDDSTHETSKEVSGPLNITVKDVTYRYPNTERDVLENLDLAITPGEKIAILGRSGAGKSTLASLIRGDLPPTKGEVLLHDVPTWELGDNISKYIGVIQQQTYLFNTSLAENLKIGAATATEEDLWEVLENVGLKEMVERLPDGLDTLVDEAGKRFSGGERHRIALARVLLTKVPIVILDEPMVGLDPFSERALLETIFRTLSDKTVIMITHHLQGVSLMDRVVFIDDGGVKLSGAPSELERENAYYQKLLAFDKGV